MLNKEQVETIVQDIQHSNSEHVLCAVLLFFHYTSSAGHKEFLFSVCKFYHQTKSVSTRVSQKPQQTICFKQQQQQQQPETLQHSSFQLPFPQNSAGLQNYLTGPGQCTEFTVLVDCEETNGSRCRTEHLTVECR